jgi:hypothetical protein
MFTHTLSRSTHTIEMAQVMELNEGIQSADAVTGECLLITAEFLGLRDTTVQLHLLDRPARCLIPRLHTDDHTLPGAAQLREVMAAGAPSFPYLYGVFAETNGGRRRLPAVLHTEQLQAISDVLRLRHHRWGL